MAIFRPIFVLFTLMGACQPQAPEYPAASWVSVEIGGEPAEDDSTDSGSSTGSGDDGGDNPGNDSGKGTDTADSGEPQNSTGTTVLYAVRHAEKQTEGADPSLTKEGQARAEALVEVMADVPLVAVYATEKTRTQETVEPTATDHGLKVVTDVDAEEELAKKILSEHGSESVLHAGHSYSLPDLFDAMGAKEADSVSGYGQLWIITVDTKGAVSVEMSTYGE